MFTEEMTAKRLPSSGFGKDSIEVEGYVRGFARRRPDAEILTLRFANIIGPRIRTSITDYSTCRSSRSRSATTRACSSSTRTTRSPHWSEASPGRLPASSTSPVTA
jgi:nucleoside-diphosphate-sugar epimerase